MLRPVSLFLLIGSATAFSFTPQLLSPSAVRCQGASRCSVRRGALSLRAQEQDQGGKSLIDDVASKGIWQGGVTGEAKEALARVGWVDGDEAGEGEAVV
eukprot:3172454-Rhodomonas_salina.3